MCHQEHQHKFAMTAEVCTLAEKVACHLAANPAVVDPVRGWTLTDIREAAFAIAIDIVGERDRRFTALHAEEQAEIDARRAEAAT